MCATDVTVRRCIDVIYAEPERNFCVIVFVTPSHPPPPPPSWSCKALRAFKVRRLLKITIVIIIRELAVSKHFVPNT